MTPTADIVDRSKAAGEPQVGPVVLVRAAGGTANGFGHVGRCLALWDEMGPEMSFVTDDERVGEILRDQGVGLAPEGSLAPIMVLDNAYPTDLAEVLELQGEGCKVCLIDDAGPARLSADLVVDPPTGISWDQARGPQLSGFDHVLIRRAIRAGADAPVRAAEILLAFGGSDPEGLTVALSRELTIAGVSVLCVLGPTYTGPLPEGEVLSAPNLWPRVLAGTDLLVTRFGHTVLEAAHLGVPCISVATSDRAMVEAAELSAHGSSVAVGPTDRSGASWVAETALDLLRDSSRLDAMAASGRALVDGQGAMRVAKVLRGLV